MRMEARIHAGIARVLQLTLLLERAAPTPGSQMGAKHWEAVSVTALRHLRPRVLGNGALRCRHAEECFQDRPGQTRHDPDLYMMAMSKDQQQRGSSNLCMDAMRAWKSIPVDI